MFCRHFLNADKSLEANLEKKNMAGHVEEDCFGVKLSLILGIMNSTDRREEKRNFLIQGIKKDASGDHLKTIVTIDIL